MTSPKSELTLLLARRLAEAGYINIVEDDVTKEDILKHTMSYVMIERDDRLEPIEVLGVVDGYTDKFVKQIYPELRSEIIGELKERAKELGANYLFVKSSCKISSGETAYSGILQYAISATPYAMLTEDDMEEKLKKAYPDGMPLDTRDKVSQCFGKYFVKLDIIDLYYNHPHHFMVEFGRDSFLTREEILDNLRRIAKLEKRNEKLDEWLSKTYPDLSAQAARDEMVNRQKGDDKK